MSNYINKSFDVIVNEHPEWDRPSQNHLVDEGKQYLIRLGKGRNEWVFGNIQSTDKRMINILPIYSNNNSYFTGSYLTSGVNLLYQWVY